MIFAFVVVTYDEIMRHRNYDKDVQDATDKLINVYKCSSDDIKRIEQEFKDKEENRGKRKDIEKERLELTEINWVPQMFTLQVKNVFMMLKHMPSFLEFLPSVNEEVTPWWLVWAV